MTQFELDNGILVKLTSCTNAQSFKSKNKKCPKPILQVLNIQNIASINDVYYENNNSNLLNNTNGNGNGILNSQINSTKNDRYLLKLTDGVYYESTCLLLPNLNYLISENKLRNGSIIRLDKYELNQIPTGKVLIIQQLTVIRSAFNSQTPSSNLSSHSPSLHDRIRDLMPTSNNMQMRFPKLINKVSSADKIGKSDKKSDSQEDQVDEEEEVDDKTEDEEEDLSEELDTIDNLQEKRKPSKNNHVLNSNTNRNGDCSNKADENNTDGEEIDDEDENEYDVECDNEDSFKCADCQDENTLHLCYKIFGITKRSVKEKIRKKYYYFQKEMKSKQKKMLEESNATLGLAPICLIPLETITPLTLIERFNLFVNAYSSVIGKFLYSKALSKMND